MKKKAFHSGLLVLILITLALASCGVYKFSEGGIVEPGVQTVYVRFVENQAPYKNPNMSPTLTESLRQKILRNTRLTNVQAGTDAHYDISATITDYSVSTSGVSNTNGRSQGSINRLNVSVHVVLNKQLANKVDQFDVTRQFDYDASLTLQQAENRLQDEMIRNLTDEIFNRIFSNW